MAKIVPYIATGTHVGQKIALKAKKVVWLTVGRGSIDTLNDHEVGIGGKVNVPGYNGDLHIHLKLMDEDAQATDGPCSLRLNANVDENARYTATPEMLTVYAVFAGKDQNISVLPCNNGAQTECKLSGYINETVHLDPY